MLLVRTREPAAVEVSGTLACAAPIQAQVAASEDADRRRGR